MVELIALFVILALLLFSAERPGVWRSVVWTGILLFLPWIIAAQVEQAWPQIVPHWFWMPPLRVPLLLWPILVVLSVRFPTKREAILDVCSAILAFFALSSVLVLGQFLWFWWSARALNRPIETRPVVTASAAVGKPRIIFIVMDELSYQQVYEHRYAGLQLPTFDTLAADSTVFTDVTPTANHTELAIPALFSGRPVEDFSATASGMLLTRSAEKDPWQRFNATDTVFADALKDGRRTAVVGWYNPYCRIMPDVLDTCYWTDAYNVQGGLTSEGSFKFNLISSADYAFHGQKLREDLARKLHLSVKFDHTTTGAHLHDFLRLEPVTDKVLLDPSAGFTFIHLPIPHPDGIYNRRTRQMTTEPSTYVDNLALADAYLAHMRALLEKSGQWDSSTVLLMGDHGWRTSLVWMKFPEWSPEEQLASLGGTFDTRPAYIVKLAGQKTGMRIDEPFNAIRTRALIDALMAGNIRSPDDLKAWVDGGRASGNQQFTAAGIVSGVN
ncbi:MAG TPA: sulfatase-like hydrolase/transferase [Acidobacteriaceae bacterium]